jgi:hypothetical protein
MTNQLALIAPSSTRLPCGVNGLSPKAALMAQIADRYFSLNSNFVSCFLTLVFILYYFIVA